MAAAKTPPSWITSGAERVSGDLVLLHVHGLQISNMSKEVKTNTQAVRVGTAGWGFSSAHAELFPVQGTQLERYAQVFSAVEINSSFYRLHQAKTYARWHDSVPASFRFSVKIPKTISHQKRLIDSVDLLREFIAGVTHLQEKLGCLLLQLPPSLAFDAVIADAFFKSLRRQTSVGLVCEPRHPTWFTPQAQELLERHLVSLVYAHPAPRPGLQLFESGPVTYARLHGAPIIYRSLYDEDFLDSLSQELTQLYPKGLEQWIIFDNTASGAAITNALQMKVLLNHR